MLLNDLKKLSKLKWLYSCLNAFVYYFKFKNTVLDILRRQKESTEKYSMSCLCISG